MKHVVSRAIFVVVLLATSAPLLLAQRGGGSGGAAQKMSGPGPLGSFGPKFGLPLFTELVNGRTVSGGGPRFAPRWLDVNVQFLFGESDFERTNVHGVIVEPSLEWAFMNARDKENWYKRIFASLGYALTNFRGDGFDNFWRASVVGRVGYRIPIPNTNGLRVGAGVRYFPTAFTHDEFGAEPGTPDRYVGFIFVEYFLWE